MTPTEPTSIVLFKHLAFVPAFLLGLSLESYFILFAFILTDTFLGVIRSGVIDGWRSVTSSRFVRGVTSKLTLMLVPIILAWAGQGVGIQLIGVAKGVLGMLILSETYSILGNIHSIHTGKHVAEFDAVNLVLKKVRQLLERIIKEDEPAFRDDKDDNK